MADAKNNSADEAKFVDKLNKSEVWFGAYLVAGKLKGRNIFTVLKVIHPLIPVSARGEWMTRVDCVIEKLIHTAPETIPEVWTMIGDVLNSVNKDPASPICAIWNDTVGVTAYRITASGQEHAKTELKGATTQTTIALHSFLKRIRWISNPAYVTSAEVVKDAKETVATLNKVVEQAERLHFDVFEEIPAVIEGISFAKYIQTNSEWMLEECRKLGFVETRGG